MLAPKLAPGDIVLLDNLRSHKTAGIAEAIIARDAQFIYLPPYSPDLNPIEQCGTAHQRACSPNEVNMSVRSRASIAIHFGEADGAYGAALTYEIPRTARIASLGWINHRLLTRYRG